MTFESYAQNYEDYYIWRALSLVQCGFYVDVGANDPDADSVSKAFCERGWRGIEIEPLPHLAKKLRQKRPNSAVVEAATGASEGSGLLYKFDSPGEGMSTFDLKSAESLYEDFQIDFTSCEVPIRTLDNILEEQDPEVIHWMKIDVEGFEAETISGLDLQKWRPWLLIIEAVQPNSTLRVHQKWESLVLGSDYIFAFFDGLNCYYVAQEHSILLDALDRPVSILDDVVSPKQRAMAELLEKITLERDDLYMQYKLALDKSPVLTEKNEKTTNVSLAGVYKALFKCFKLLRTFLK